MMPSVHPGMLPMQQAPVPGVQASYPTGQGPLANRPINKSANGLFEAPEPEGPEEHEAARYIKLNPQEELKYSEYWETASEGEEKVSGANAVPFLSRAEKVSRGQLRRIWDLADHRKEGELDRTQFFIALRLLALAQRGAELSLGGLRSFTGIQLLPSIEPPPKEEEKEEEEEEEVREEDSAPEKLFSWTVVPDVADRYDRFFNMLDQAKRGFIDGKQGVTFFGKSGLPRPVLRKIWGLADVTLDGMLSLDEFRTAMHMVTCIKNNRLSLSSLPEALDPNGPNWLRVTDQQPVQPQQPLEPQPPAPGPTDEAHEGVPSSAIPLGPPPTETAVQSQLVQVSPQTSLLPENSDTSTIPTVITPMPPQFSPVQQQPPQAPVLSPVPSSIPDSGAMAQVELARQEADRAESMLKELRKERERMDRAREEMEEMRMEMERMRLAREAMAKEQQAMPPMMPSPHIPVNGQTMKPSLGNPLQKAPVMHSNPVQKIVQPVRLVPPVQATPPVMPVMKPGVVKNASPSVPIAMPPPPAPIDPLQKNVSTPPVQAQEPRTPPPMSPAVNKSKDAGDDDDIWDQPSPKANPMAGPSVPNQPFGAQRDDSLSSDDDDDFWGAAGLGAKPSLGDAGASKPGDKNSKGFGGSELDDWVF